jgi:inhibitor of cysteine peptidase
MKKIRNHGKEVFTMKLVNLLMVLFVIGLMVGCTTTEVVTPPEPVDNPVPVDPNLNNNQNNNVNTNNDPLSFEGVKKFNSGKEVLEYLTSSKGSGSNTYFGGRNMVLSDGMDMVAESAVMSKGMSAPSVSNSGGQSTSDYSKTNVQVEGVDEADIIKNDGKYVYIVNQNRLVIVDAYPATKSDVVYEEKLEGRPQDMFINDNKLIVFIEDNTQELSIQPFDFMPRPRYVQQTRILVYDTTDKTSPEIVENYTMTGDYFQSRMIGDYVYFVVKDQVYYYDNFIDLPMIKEDAGMVVRPEVFYFDNPEDNYVFHTVGSFNINEDESMEAKSFLMGYSNTLYVSENNMYISYQKNRHYWHREYDKEERFFEVVVELLPTYEQNEIKKIQNSKDEDYEKWIKISVVMQDMYDEFDKKEAEKLVEEINEALNEYDYKKEAELRKTVIHKIKINKGDIEYQESGEVSGYLLNQFSLDENDGNLRVATTTNLYVRGTGRIQHNNVYVMDEDMEVIGKLENLAEDERIYSTRFMGDRLYMVTFKRIDPLFVIDLSDPEDPSVLGELKIPGYSDYLHPYDENHIIGLGKETGSNEWGGTSIKGVKLSLFDVSNVNNPKQIDKYEIGDRGTDSEALRDHKAFLFDKEKNILVIPVREVNGERYYDNNLRYYRQDVWQGAYVFGLTPKDGFEVKGRISHQEGLERYYYYYSGNAVRRALYMDNVLYTISGKKILMNDLNDDLEEINELKLPYDENQKWYWY